MGLLSWVLLGFLAGTLATLVTRRRTGSGCLSRVAVGVVGALVGGSLARAAGYEGIDELSLRSILVAAVGAVAFLLVLGAIEGRRT